MVLKPIYAAILTVLWLTITINGTTPSRKLTVQLNPGCDPSVCHQNRNTSSYNLIYTKAEGSNDTFHHLWSTIGSPASLIFLTSTTSKMTIDFDQLISQNSTGVKGAIKFSEEPFYASGLIISKLVQFNDSADDGLMPSNCSQMIINSLNDLKWDAVKDSIASSDSHGQATFSTLSYDNDDVLGEGRVTLKFDVSGLEEEHDDTLPKLLRNSNSSQIKLDLYGLPTNFNGSRYAVEIVLFNSETENGDWDKTILDLINDEYTPGVFKNVQLKSVQSKKAGFGNFLTWKPIAYTSGELTVTDSTLVNLNDLRQSNDTDEIPFSIADAYFDRKDVSQIFNVSFGTEQDGFFEKYQYTSWALVYGVGVPTNETFSILVILTVACGTGIPILLMFVSSVYILRSKYLKRKQARD